MTRMRRHPTPGEIARMIPDDFHCHACSGSPRKQLEALQLYLDRRVACCEAMVEWIEAARARSEAGDRPDKPEETVSTTLPPAVPSRLADFFTIYCDGAAKRNPGPAGCGYVILAGGVPVAEGSASIGEATNQYAEIMAAVMALEAVPPGSTIDLYSDSQYVVKTMADGWKRRANLEGWIALDRAATLHRKVRWHHVRGHSGEHWNEHVDRLASSACRR